MPVTPKDKKDPNRPACHLIALCTDSHSIDINALAAVLAQSAMFAPTLLKDPTAAQQRSQVDAVLAALEMYSGASGSDNGGGTGGHGRSSALCSSAANAALLKASANSGKSGGKGAKGKAGGNTAVQQSQATAAKAAQGQRDSGLLTPGAAGVPTSVGDESMTKQVPRPRSEWYDVVRIPHCELPMIFIHHLPDLERSEDDNSTHLSRALEIIASELEMESIGREIVVVMPVRDTRTMASLAGSQSNIDTRLVVQFLDSPRSVGTGESQGRTSNRGRVGNSSKRTPTTVLLDNNGAVVQQPPASNSFEAWIDRQQREKLLALVDGAAAAVHTLGPICIRAPVDEVSDEKSGPLAAWVECCLQTVLPTVCQVVSGISGYGEIVSSKPLIRYPCFPVKATAGASEDATHNGLFTSPVTDGTAVPPFLSPNSMSVSQIRRSKAVDGAHSSPVGTPHTAAAATSTSARLNTMETASGVPGNLGKWGEATQTNFIPPTSVSRSEVGWSEYVHKRKVRGHFTCISAVRALAAQVSVTMAQREQAIIDQSFELEEKRSTKGEEEEREKKVNVRESELKESNETMDDRAEDTLLASFASKSVPTTLPLNKAATGPSVIRRTLRDYVSRRCTFTSGTSHRSVGIALDSCENMSPLPPQPPTLVGSVAEVASGEGELRGVTSNFFKSSVRPKEHMFDRLSARPFPEDIYWITQQFVKKGLDAYVLSTAEAGADADPSAEGSTDHFSVTCEGERLRATSRMCELLEDPLNVLSVEAEDEAVDRQVLAIVEDAFAREFVERTRAGRASSTSAPTTALAEIEAAEDMAVRRTPLGSPSLFGLLGELSLADMTPLDERLQRSVERSLTTRERQHILQQLFLERSVAAVCMSGTNDRDKCSTIATLVTTQLRPIEEHATTAAAVRRMYEFQSRFGAHACRLLRRDIPDVMEMLAPTTTSSNCTENVNPPKRAIAIMAAGVPTPSGRRVHRLWCHLVSGVPSLDEFCELAATESLRNTGEVNAGTEDGAVRLGSLTIPDGQVHHSDLTCRHGTPIEVFIRRQLLQRLRDSAQFLLPTGRQEDPTSRPNGAQTVLEGRHALYPHCNAIVEVITTDRGRMCRYVKSSELCCTLHYSIPPPPTPLSSVAQPKTQSTPAPVSSSSACGQTHTENENATDLTSPSTLTPMPITRDESIYLTVSFDDGVTLTCTRRLKETSTCSTGEKAIPIPTNTSNSAQRASSSHRGSRQRRRVSGSQRTGTAQGVDEDGYSTRGTSLRRKTRGRDSIGARATTAGSGRADDTRWTFPVAADGSVLLWPGGAQRLNSTRLTSANTGQGPVEYNVTLSAGGITLHAEERGGIVWLSRHEARTYPAPESLCCVHAVEGCNTVMRKSMEVEVRRAIIQGSGTVYRFFQSGSTQTLYANGAVLTRFPCVPVVPIYSGNMSSTVCETLVTVNGECFARELNAYGGKGETAKFLRLTTTISTSDAYDPQHHCQILSRADGVTVVRYLSRKVDGSSLKNSLQNASPINPSLSRYEDARVVLHSDGTSITTLASDNAWHLIKVQTDSTPHTHTGQVKENGNKCKYENEMDHVPPPLRPLISQIATVAGACGGHVRYCIEAPTLPRLFLCGERRENSTCSTTETNRVLNTRQSLSSTDRKQAPPGAPPKASSCMGGNSWSNLSLSHAPVQALEAPMRSQDVENPQVVVPLSSTRAVCDGTFPSGTLEDSSRRAYSEGFYVAFADGSVLCRRVVLRGTRPTPFLETLFTRTTETSVRVIHDSGIVVVEPADAVRRNVAALSSLAIGEGFPMFDLTLGGLRLVDHEHHVTEVSDLYSPGAVRAAVVPTSLESLLRELVAPSYTPHLVPRARQKVLDAEKAESEAQYLRDRSMGICPPLVRRLREFAEGFIIEHQLLNVGVLLAGVRAFEGSRAIHVGGPLTLHAAATACWGAADPARLVSHLTDAQQAGNTTPSAELFTGKAKGMQESVYSGELHTNRAVSFDRIPKLDQTNTAIAPTTGVAPLLFSEIEGGLVVQYLHDRDVDDCLCAMDGEPLPVYLSRSVPGGEPGVQQWTLFRVAANGLDSTRGLHGSCAALSPTAIGAEKYGSIGTLSCAVSSGSILSEAVRREERLNAVAGFCVPVHTCAWLPPALQPPRRHLDSRMCRATPVWPAGISHLVNGGHSLIDLDESSEVGRSLPATYKRLRVFLRFSEVTWEARQAVLWGEMRRFQQLASLVAYQRAALQISQRTEEEETQE